MNLVEKVSISVEKLISSDIKANQIERETGVSRAKIGRLRKGINCIDDLSFKTIKKLYDYQAQYFSNE